MSIKDLRNIDINLYYYIETKLVNNGYTILSGYNKTYVASGIYLNDGYPTDFKDIKTPTVVLEHTFTRPEGFQLGVGRQDSRQFVVDVWARSDGERDDLGELVRNFFNSSMTIYNYNNVLASGYYNSVGLADFASIRMFPIREEDFRSLSHGMRIVFNCDNLVPTGNSLI